MNGNLDEGQAARRYTDAYSVARQLVASGNSMKALGAVAGALVAVLGLLLASSLGTVAVVGGVAVGIGVWSSAHHRGQLTAAQGQILLAVLDTAVNTSPLLSNAGKAALLGGSPTTSSAPSISDGPPRTGDTPGSSSPDGRTPRRPPRVGRWAEGHRPSVSELRQAANEVGIDKTDIASMSYAELLAAVEAADAGF